MDAIALQIGLIGILGIGAQWIAWRWQIPAIVLLMAAGLVAGPLTGLVNPEAVFGDLLRPLIGLAVAIILFEGGLTLNFAEIRETSRAVRRIVIIGAPLSWGLLFLAAHHVAGLSVPAAAVFSGIMVVTGPTVIMPLLRQARLPSRPASFLRWEAILVDPVGALFAVFAYETVLLLNAGHGSAEALLARGALALAVAFALGIGLGRLLIWAFIRGHVPEYLKAAVLLIAVLVAFEATNHVLEEAGLLTVTVMGVVIGNSNIASFNEIRRFKEIMTVLLVSGIFVILTATVTLDDMARIGLPDLAFLALLLFVVRPLAVLLSTVGTTLTFRERLLCGWIAPRGVVAVAVSGLFAAGLADLGVEDGARLVPLAFLVVFATVILHGFTIQPLARLLGLSKKEPDGVMIVGASAWSTAFARRIREMEIPVMIADANWNRLREAREAGIPTYFGEILAEAAEHKVDFGRYGALIAATDNDAYNSLVCTDFGPEIGRGNVFQIGRAKRGENGRNALPATIGGQPLFEAGTGFSELRLRIGEGWGFSRTKLTSEYGIEDFLAARGEDAAILLLLKASGKVVIGTKAAAKQAEPGDTLLGFGPKPAEQPDG